MDDANIKDLSNWVTDAHNLRARLVGRQRTEIFYPGSLAPELMRRSEEMLTEGIEVAERILLADALRRRPSQEISND